VLPFCQLPCPPPNKALQLTPSSWPQSGHGGILAAAAQPQRWRSALFGAAERHPLAGVTEVLIEALSLIAEVAVGLAGFAGVAVMLGRGPGRWSPGDALRIRLLLTAAFTALFATLIAIGSEWAGTAERTSVQLGAAALLSGQVYWGAVVARQIPRLEPPERALFDPRLALLFRVTMYSSWGAQLVALSGLLAPAGRWLFLYGLLVCLAYAALAFVRLLYIRPAWD